MKKTYHTHKSIKGNNKNVINHVTNTYTNNINITNNIDTNSKKDGLNQKKSKIKAIISTISIICSITGITGVGIYKYIHDDKDSEQVSIDDENPRLVQSEKAYKEYLINNIDMNYLVTEFIYADFDYNNTYEMFAIADNELESALYYVDSNGILKLDEWMYTKFKSRLNILNLDQQSFIILTDGARAAGHKGDIWTVYNGAPCQIFSKNVYSVDTNEYNEIIIRETYSRLSSGGDVAGTGITMKPYYFYYSNGKLFEYGGKIKYGKEVSQPPEEFLNYSESSEILEGIDNRGYFVVKYLFRINDTITLNLRKKEELPVTIDSPLEAYETYRVIDGSLVLEDSGIGSNYLSPYCLVPEAATY